MVNELGIPRGDLVLDVGCGRGYFSFATARVAGLAIGIDLMDAFGRIG